MRIVSETSGTISNTPTVELQGVSEEEEKKGMRKCLKRLQLKYSPMESPSPQSSPRGTESPIQSKSLPRRNRPRNILIKLTKTKHKEGILKVAREKQPVTYKENPISLTVDLSAETLQVRRERQDIFKILKGKNLQPRLLYLASSLS